jgi:hypothetical protein
MITIVAPANVASSRTLGPQNFLADPVGGAWRAIFRASNGTAAQWRTVKLSYDSLEKFLTQ